MHRGKDELLVKDARGQVLFGNSFPLSLIRRRVVIDPRPIEELQRLLQENGVCSFWGHSNTVGIASAAVGTDVSPATARPVLSLNIENLPVLDGRIFRECWILSPDYVAGFRPAVGEEVGLEKVLGWQVLRIEWT